MATRKLFKFYRSYYDVALELPKKERGEFLWAILQKQFEGIDPDLKGICKFAYISQKHSIDLQVKGWEDRTGEKLTPMQGGGIDPMQGPSIQEEVEEKVEEKVEVEEEEKVEGEVLAEQVRSLQTNLPKEEIDKFLDYWTEKNPGGKKMRYQMQKTFDPKRRLKKWEANYFQWKKEKSSAKKEKVNGLDILREINKANGI